MTRFLDFGDRYAGDVKLVLRSTSFARCAAKALCTKGAVKPYALPCCQLAYGSTTRTIESNILAFDDCFIGRKPDTP